MTLVEVWAKYGSKGAQEDADKFVYYTHDGINIRGDGGRIGAGSALLLLGRYLCDDELGIRDEIRLLGFLKEKYKEEEEENSLLAVMKCLYDSNFITEHKSHKILGGLKDESPSKILDALDASNITDQVASKNKQITKVLLPILSETIKYAKQTLNQAVSFGRKKVRVMRAFV